MKKLLLSMAAVALCASASWANETTLVFDAESGDLGDWARIVTDNVCPTAEQCVKEISFKLDDFNVNLTSDLELKNSSDELVSTTGNGFALYSNSNSAKEIQRGIIVTGKTNTQLTLTVPNGTITAVKLVMSGYSLAALDVNINGKTVSSVSEGTTYSWSWSDANGGDSVTMEWYQTPMAMMNLAYFRFIHSIEVTYTPDLGGKEECGLSFSRATADGVVGDEFTAPVLSNPNNLPLTWTSSDESVATVDEDGTVTLVGGGTTTITAATEGNDDYAAGNARYTLSVVGAANNIAELLTYAPANGNTVKVNFPVTVAFCSKGNVFVIGPDGAAAHFNDLSQAGSTGSGSNICKVGDVIPAGWMATNETNQGQEVIWNGIFPKSEETVEVTYPVVEKVTNDDTNRVLTLNDVTFTVLTSAGGDAAYTWAGKTPDGVSYTFDNTYGAPEMPAGTYNVTFVANYVPRMKKLYLKPISYNFTFPETFKVTATEGVTVDPADEMAQMLFEDAAYRFGAGGSVNAAAATLTIEVPEGWDGLIGTTVEMDMPGIMRKAKAFAWNKLDTFKAEEGNEELKEGNVIEIPANGKYHAGNYYLYKSNYVDTANPIQFLAKVERTLEFPDAFGVKVNGKYDPMNVVQGLDDADTYVINVNGLSEDETVDVEIEVPEGWDGFYSMTMADFDPSEIEPMKAKVKAIAEVIDDESAWMTEEQFNEEYPMATFMKKDQNSFTFKVESDEEVAMMFLYKGDKIYTAGEIKVEANVGKMPVVPESITVSVDSEEITVTDGEDEELGAYVINVTGKTDKDDVTLEFDIPEGWTGFVGMFTEFGEMSARKARSINPVEWTPLENIASEEGVTTGKKFVVAADGKTHRGQFMLYKGNQVDVANMFAVVVNVEKAEVEPAPAFPAEFLVEVSDENIDIEQENDGENGYYIILSGETKDDTVTVKLETPEGWDGFYGLVWSEDMAGGDGPTPLARKRARAIAEEEAEEFMWMPIDELLEEMPLEKTNELTLQVDTPNAMGIMYLYKGDMALYQPIMINSSVTKAETEEPAPTFPESFTHSLSTEPSEDGLKVEVNTDNEGVYEVNISGKTDKTEVTITFDVPEGWDGFIGMTDSEQEPEVSPRMAATRAAEPEWAPVDEMLEFGMTKRNGLTFKVNNEEQFGQLYLYKGDMAEVGNFISVNFAATDIATGIAGIEAADKDARYFTLQGVEVKNPESGVYVKISNGKASKVTVK